MDGFITSSGEVPNSAYDHLRKMILGGELEMGARLIEVRLAEALCISRTPVREALRRLTSDGLVVFEPNKGYRVVRYSTADVREIYNCRAVLESEAVRLVSERGLTAAGRQTLETLVKQAEELFASDIDALSLRRGMIVNNNAFHAALYADCGNATLLRLIEQTCTIPIGIRNYFLFSDDRLEISHAAHVHILRAVVNRQADRAAALVREHIWTAKDQMIDDESGLTVAA